MNTRNGKCGKAFGFDLRCGGGRVTALEKTKTKPAQRNAEVVDEVWSGRAVLILKGGATE